MNGFNQVFVFHPWIILILSFHDQLAGRFFICKVKNLATKAEFSVRLYRYKSAK